MHGLYEYLSMHGLDGMKRFRNNRSLTVKDRGAFDIQKVNHLHKRLTIIGSYNIAQKAYMQTLKARIQKDQMSNRIISIKRWSLLAIVILGLSYLIWGLSF